MALRFTTSIRWRLLAWLAALLVVLVSGFGVTAYQLIRARNLQAIDDALSRRLAALVGDVRGAMPGPRPPDGGEAMPPPSMGMPPPDGRPEDNQDPTAGPPRMGLTNLFVNQSDGAATSPNQSGRINRMPGGPPGRRTVTVSAGTLALFDAQAPERPYYAWWMRDVSGKSDTTPEGLARPQTGRGDGLTRFRTRGAFREAYLATEFGDCVLTGVSLAPHESALLYLAFWLALAGLVMLVVGAGGGWVIVNRALHPVEKISATAARIATGKLGERIDVAETESELGQLAAVLNDTFERLERAFAEQKRFTADASHELRTPLAVIIAEAQMTLKRERDSAEYREALGNCLDAAQQMRRLADTLLELARFDAGQEFLRKSEGDLGGVARECANLLKPLAESRGIRLELDLAVTPIRGDLDRLARLTTNLLDNAIYYNRDGGVVRLRTALEGDRAVLTVADSGCGIAPEDRARVFERFYRVDSSRTSTRQRHGLGLAICKAIVDAHGGAIEVESVVGEGTTFRVRLPAAAPTAAGR